MGWIKSHWQTVIGIVFAALPYLGRSLRFVADVVGYGGSIDFILARSSNPGWVAKVVNFAFDLPAPLAVLCLLIGIVLILRGERKRVDAILSRHLGSSPEPAQEAGAAPSVMPSALDPNDLVASWEPSRLYIGRTTVAANELADHNRLELAVIGFNGSEHAFRLSKVSGCLIASYKGGDGTEQSLEMTPPLYLPDRASEVKNPLFEFLFVFHCQLSPSQAKFVQEGLAGGSTVNFDARNVHIELEDANSSTYRLALPILGGVTVRRAKAGELFYGSIAYITAGVRLKSAVTLD